MPDFKRRAQQPSAVSSNIIFNTYGITFITYGIIFITYGVIFIIYGVSQ